jgi:hypothetical protein
MARSSRRRFLQHVFFFEYSRRRGDDSRVIRFYIGTGLLLVAIIWVGIATHQLPFSMVLRLLR